MSTVKQLYKISPSINRLVCPNCGINRETKNYKMPEMEYASE